MNYDEIAKRLEEHLNSISDEQFEKELIDAGATIGSSSRVGDEIFLHFKSANPIIPWGVSIYSTTKQHVVVVNKEVA
ncbi:MAG: hypothetical protein WA118_13610 [Carboxydocellales bacterium]